MTDLMDIFGPVKQGVTPLAPETAGMLKPSFNSLVEAQGGNIKPTPVVSNGDGAGPAGSTGGSTTKEMMNNMPLHSDLQNLNLNGGQVNQMSEEDLKQKSNFDILSNL